MKKILALFLIVTVTLSAAFSASISLYPVTPVWSGDSINILANEGSNSYLKKTSISSLATAIGGQLGMATNLNGNLVIRFLTQPSPLTSLQSVDGRYVFMSGITTNLAGQPMLAYSNADNFYPDGQTVFLVSNSVAHMETWTLVYNDSNADPDFGTLIATTPNLAIPDTFVWTFFNGSNALAQVYPDSNVSTSFPFGVSDSCSVSDIINNTGTSGSFTTIGVFSLQFITGAYNTSTRFPFAKTSQFAAAGLTNFTVTCTLLQTNRLQSLNENFSVLFFTNSVSGYNYMSGITTSWQSGGTGTNFVTWTGSFSVPYSILTNTYFIELSAYNAANSTNVFYQAATLASHQ